MPFAVVQGVQYGATLGQNVRLLVQSAVSLFVNLPLGYQQKLATVPGVEAICKWQWFGGTSPDVVRRRLKVFKWALTAFFLALGLATLAFTLRRRVGLGFVGRGDGTFHYPPRNYRTKNGPFAVASYRVSADNAEEPGLVTADNGAGSVSVFLHHGRMRPAASGTAE